MWTTNFSIGTQNTGSKSELFLPELTIPCSCTTCMQHYPNFISVYWEITKERGEVFLFPLTCIFCILWVVSGDRCIRPTSEELEDFGTPDFTTYNAGQFPCNRYTHYMTSSTSIDINLARKEMVILGTQYAGEMKKGLFSLMHYLMPKRQILSLHSGCNMGKDGDVALFFGLSGAFSFDHFPSDLWQRDSDFPQLALRFVIDEISYYSYFGFVQVLGRQLCLLIITGT